MSHKLASLLIVAIVALLAGSGSATAQEPQPALSTPLGTAFTYQGRLSMSGSPASGPFDFEFYLFDSNSSITPIGGPIPFNDLVLSDGYFTVLLDFGAGAFNGQMRYLEARVKTGSDPGAFTILEPRQELSAAPYALYAVNNWSLRGNSGTNPASQYLGTSDNTPLELRVNGARALRLEPNLNGPNLIGGYNMNWITTGVYGATLFGGGIYLSSSYPNRVTDIFGTVSGGINNQAGDNDVTLDDARGATAGGGAHNLASGSYATVGGGYGNGASNDYTTVGGGRENQASRYMATVGGGNTNQASADHSTVSGGEHNQAKGNNATVGGGYYNQASSYAATVGGGRENHASGYMATAGGGYYNIASGDYTTIAGGGPSDPNNLSTTYNRATDNYATIGGGGNNRAGDGDANPASQPYATVSGGEFNTANADHTTIGGGYLNVASGNKATIGGGEQNQASGSYATVGGGRVNQASGSEATIGGGSNNVARGNKPTIGGGFGNEATHDFTTISGGFNNTASGAFATAGGGIENRAEGDYSFTIGRRAVATSNAWGSFVWSDSNNFDTISNHPNEFVARATGGVFFATAIDANGAFTAGVGLPSGSSQWYQISDRNMKMAFQPIDAREIAARVAELPIQTWSYKAQSAAVRHIGPMAQDFYAAFGLGEDERYIGTLDVSGVALAAIQGLYQQNQQLEAENAALKAQIGDIEQRLAALESGGSSQAARPFYSWLAQGSWLLLAGLGFAAAIAWRRKAGKS